MAGVIAPATAVTSSAQLAATSNATISKQSNLVGASAASGAKKYVVFRDDDIGVGSLDTLQAINQVHIDENVPVTLAVVPNFQDNPDNALLKEPLHSYLQSIVANPLFEFAQHGYNHENYVPYASSTLAQASLVPGRPYADIVGADTRSEFRGRPYDDQYDAIKEGRDNITAVFGVTPTTFVPPFNTGDKNTLKAANALGFTLYSTSQDDFGVTEANLQGITVQALTFGLGWSNDTQWNWRMQNLTKYTDAALDAAAPGDSIVVYYHYWTFDKQDGSPDPTNIALLKQYIEHLKNRGDVLFTTLGDQQVLKASSEPAVCSQDENSLDVFGQSAYHTLWHKHWNSTTGWSAWEDLGGVLTSSPAATSLGNGVVHVFVRGSDGALWGRYTTNGGAYWSNWYKIGGQLLNGTGPAAYEFGGSRTGVFVTGTNNALYHIWTDFSGSWSSSSWSSWQNVGGYLTSSPAAASPSSGVINVYVRGSDGALWERSATYGGVSWSTWSKVGGLLASGTGPTVCADGNGLNVFVQGTDGALWWKHYTSGSGWGAWLSLGGVLTSAPAAVSRSAGTIDVFVRGTNGSIWERSYNSRWGAWTSVGSTFAAFA
jgi:peptidoglycan/xylan/chitin deacetylase (PgdA/CDA1 family)